MEAIEVTQLREIIGHDAKIVDVYEGGRRVLARWDDGSEASLFFKYNEWHFCDDNLVYQSQYAYACGYHD